MPYRFDCQSMNSAAYLARPAERLVLEGYRHWVAGAALGSGEPWREVRRLYSDLVGPGGSTAALLALSEFVATLGRCASCPLRTFESGSRHVCRDEVLVLGLIAGMQNHDEEATELCLSEFACSTRCAEVTLAAGTFALILRGLDRTLLPIPAPVVRDILHRSHAARSATTTSHTLH